MTGDRPPDYAPRHRDFLIPVFGFFGGVGWQITKASLTIMLNLYMYVYCVYLNYAQDEKRWPSARALLSKQLNVDLSLSLD